MTLPVERRGQKPLLSRQSPVVRNLTVLASLFILTLLGILIYTIVTLNEQRLDAAVVDLAGRQRMLNQRHLNEVLLASRGQAVDVYATRTLLGQTLAALTNGGPAALAAKRDETVELQPAPTTEIKEKLALQKNLIAEFTRKADEFLMLKASDPAYRPKLEELLELNARLQDAANDAVRLFAEHAESKIGRMVRRISAVGLFAGMLAILLTLQILRANRTLESEIAERARAEEALTAGEERVRLIVENALDAVIVMDRTGIVTGWNHVAETTFGWSHAEAVGQVLASLIIPQQYREAHSQGLQRFLATGEGAVLNRRIEITALRRDGSEFPVELAITPLRAGDRVTFSAFVRDISDRKRAEAALRESEERFRLIMTHANDAILYLDLRGTIRWANPQAGVLAGRPMPELIGRTLKKMLTPDSWTLAEERLAAVRRGEAVSPLVDFEILRPNGSVIQVEAGITSVQDKEATVGRLLVLRDSSERKRAEEAVKKTNRQLEAANKELEAFSYSVSHDLRAPLRSIDGFSRILIEEHAQSLAPDAARYLGIVRRNSQRMGRLIDDLLAFARLSRQEIKRQTVKPAELVRRCRDEMHAEMEGRRVDIQIGELPECQADPALLKQVWMNLFSNALKYTGKAEAAVIQAGAMQQDGECVYFLKDNGVGFSMQHVDKLFGVFQRLHRAEDYEGTGVGLAIVQRVIHRHGGRVWAEAAVNQGATFYFTLGTEGTDV